MKPLILPWKGVWPTIDPTAFVAPGATVIGRVTIGARSSIWFNVVLRGDINDIAVGCDSNVQDGTIVHVSGQHGTVIGNGVTIGHSAVVHACRLEDGAFVGIGASVLDEAVVESGAQIAASALVTPRKRVTAGMLWAGVPAKPLRQLSEAERAHNTDLAQRYVVLAQSYRDQLSASIAVPPAP
jgi:carbonic anhydrase/acetyltransferase-like protein (isoleucine patch superfamily)